MLFVVTLHNIFFKHLFVSNKINSKMKKIIFVLIACLSVNYILMSQTTSEHHIKWDKTLTINNNDKELLFFNNAVYPKNNLLPYYFERIQIKIANPVIANIKLKNQIYQTINAADIKNVASIDEISSDFEISGNIIYDRNVPFLEFHVLPVRKDPVTLQYQILTDFTVEYDINEGEPQIVNFKGYRSSSVLNSGQWVKVKLKSDGVYKITYDELISMGFTGIKNIRIHGNGGKLLPVYNSDFRYDDLEENAIQVVKGSDGVFNSGDYILFYGTSTTDWEYDASGYVFKHTYNLFSEYSYYFITNSATEGKTIETENYLSLTPGITVNKFQDYSVYEKDSLNLIKSGSQWFWRHFDLDLSHTLSYNFPNIDLTSQSYITTYLLARSTENSDFDIFLNNTLVNNVEISYTTTSGTAPYANFEKTVTPVNPTSSTFNIKIDYNKSTTTSEGWIDYVAVNVTRNLIMSGSQMQFRNTSCIGTGNITRFNITYPGSDLIIWDITDRVNIKRIATEYSGGIVSFIVPTDSLKQFIAFNGDSYLSVSSDGAVANQNLHGAENIDLVIVTHPNFLASANRLADIHRTNDNLTVLVATNEQVYNEFSSGTPDVSAIKYFMKMLYDKTAVSTRPLKYLLLMGDGSFDNRNYTAENSNFILTYQSPQSLRATESFVTDDYFGLLDDGEGAHFGGLDIGIGRLPVKTAEEASSVVTKIENYITNQKTYGDWRNSICFIGDDEDSNTHMSQANQLATKVDTLYPVYNQNKILLDAYEQVSTPAGEKYPDANLAIENQMQKGALIINYTGHGNEVSWAHEQILTVSDINNWTNFDKLPLFMTATCEFSRFDDYERTSAGEQILLNPAGGGIGLLTTTRLVYSAPNFTLNLNFYDFVFERDENDEYYRLGDIMRLTKVATGSGTNKLNFTLLGDPALRLAIPEHQVNTLRINDVAVSDIPDTLKALSLVSISGEVVDLDGNKIPSSGILYPTVFDKPVQVITLSNDSYTAFTFDVQNNILYKGKASINNGDFTFSFIVPKDIAYNIGYGKLSYYATIDNTDAHGYYRNVIIGGSSDSVANDETGPEISLFMNNDNFIFGGITDEDPKLLAYVSDSSGINTVGNGIGHDITAIIDESTNETYILNEYYESDLDSYQTGKVSYNFSDLTEGHHKLKLKVWDVYNNSSEEYIEFIVAKSAELVLEHIFNYPNPFTTSTDFYFDHNQPNSSLDVIIQVFTVSGKLIKTIDTSIFSDGFRSEPIHWDGKDDYGDPIGRGVYVYRIKVRSEEGKVVNKFEKLVILK